MARDGPRLPEIAPVHRAPPRVDDVAASVAAA
eukprot:CAMPEP_0196669658 /NCGR_PEP_ID=MMETSP1090-20130531/782_1 /TAXON_ID=37098 /ORGANISM="Isochrysis sp, Strain CCMP1244" /LENGTH=31 /DNA_ID= /DNA_START= /DNA_END= /DNA_ORIENTATION=